MVYKHIDLISYHKRRKVLILAKVIGVVAVWIAIIIYVRSYEIKKFQCLDFNSEYDCNQHNGDE